MRGLERKIIMADADEKKVQAYNAAWRRKVEQVLRQWEDHPTKDNYRMMITNAYHAFDLTDMTQADLANLHPVFAKTPIVLLYVKSCPVMFNPALKKQVKTVLSKTVSFLKEHQTIVARQLAQDYLLKLRVIFMKKGWALDKEVYEAWIKVPLMKIANTEDATPSMADLKDVLKGVNRYEHAMAPNKIQQDILRGQLADLKSILIAQQQNRNRQQQAADNGEDAAAQMSSMMEAEKLDSSTMAAKARVASQKSRMKLDAAQSMGEDEARKQNGETEHTHLVINVGEPGQRLKIQTVKDNDEIPPVGDDQSSDANVDSQVTSQAD